MSGKGTGGEMIIDCIRSISFDKLGMKQCMVAPEIK